MFVELKMLFEKINYLELSYSSLNMDATFKLFQHFVIGSLFCLGCIGGTYLQLQRQIFFWGGEGGKSENQASSEDGPAAVRRGVWVVFESFAL